jgi:hypothetical protein
MKVFWMLVKLLGVAALGFVLYKMEANRPCKAWSVERGEMECVQKVPFRPWGR